LGVIKNTINELLLLVRRTQYEPKRMVREMKGQILKIKTGYNPNSSSIGVDVVVFFTAGAAVTVLFNTLAAVLSAAKVQQLGRIKESGELPGLNHRDKQGL
jgi:hypothetical protein